MSHHPSHVAAFAVILVGLTGATPPAAAQSPFSSITWRSIGPVNTSGRIDDIAVARVKGKADAVYVATASGGLWKSANNGTSWTPVFDHVDAMMSIGAVAVAPSQPLTVWVGPGEANTRQSSSWGDGVYKSTDGGETWTDMGLEDTRSIGRIVIDPTDPNIVYVAAQGHLWGPNAERGLFKTTDAGRTWNKVLFVDENTGATDLVIDPGNPAVLYVAMYQRQRRTWGFNGGGPGSGIYKTNDGGATWTELTNGLPAGDKGRPPGRRCRPSTPARTTTRRSASTRRTTTTSTSSAPIAGSTSRRTAAGPSSSCSATCTARTTPSGSIPNSRIT
ncbi:MAG: hypothetical protein P8188_17215 [Gemmatimonadota bacterium]